MKKENTLQDRYTAMETARSGVLERGRRSAALTIPAVLPVSGLAESSELPVPYQSLGARGVRNIAARLTTALFPPGQKSFRLIINPESKGPDDKPDAKVDAILVQYEKKIDERIQTSSMRAGINTALQHLAITGCPLVYLTKNFKPRVYRLDHYVVQRQPDGTLLEVIVKDEVDIQALPLEWITTERMRKKRQETDPVQRKVILYTQAIRRDYYEAIGQMPSDTEVAKPKDTDRWVIRHSVDGEDIPAVNYRRRCPYIAPRWDALAGENYGRSHTEDNYGDLRAYDGLQQSILEAAAASSRVVFLCNPAGLTDPGTINKAENGDYVSGRQEDVAPMLADLAANMQVAVAQAQVIEQRLGSSYMLNSAVQPEGERVTATQIRQIAAELEGTLGGIYTSLAQELQLPLIELVIDRMIEVGEIKPEADGVIKPIILTGFEALGREQELVRVQAFIQLIAQLGEEQLDYINIPELVVMTKNALSITGDNLVRKEDEVRRIRAQRAAQLQAIQSAGAIAENAASNAQPQQAA